MFRQLFYCKTILCLVLILQNCRRQDMPIENIEVPVYERQKLVQYYEKIKKLPAAQIHVPFKLTLPPGTIPPRQKLSWPMTLLRVELGRWLFYDPILSKNNGQSCAHCHNQKYSFGSNTRVNLGVDGQLGIRNTMPLVNLLWDTHFFWDGRASTLEEAVLLPIESAIEMNLSIEEALAKLNKDAIYLALFRKAYQLDGKIEKVHLANALAQFVGSLVSFESPMDYLHRYDEKLIPELPNHLKDKTFSAMGQTNVFTAAQCGSCHAGPFLYGQTNFDDIGLDRETELGRAAVTGNPVDKGKYKTTNLRNIAVSAPYMHDGRFSSLEEVIEHYNSRVKSSPNLAVLLRKRESGKPLRLELTQKQKEFLVQFLQLMTDEAFLKNPYFANPFAPEAIYHLLSLSKF